MKDQAWVEARIEALTESRDKWAEGLEKSRANIAAHNGAIEALQELLKDDPPTADGLTVDQLQSMMVPPTP